MFRGEVYRLGTHQSASYTEVSGAITNATDRSTQLVRIITTSPAYVAFGSSVAASTDIYVPAATPRIFVVAPSVRIAAVEATTAGDGVLHVTELSG